MTDNGLPVLLAVDGPSLVHRFYHALQHTGMRSPTGRPAWAVHGFVNQLLAAAARFHPAALVVGFDDQAGNVRRDGPDGYPRYKEGRPERDPDLTEQLTAVADLLAAAGVTVITPPGLEADDVLASAAHVAATLRWRTVLVTSDKDAYALISDTTSLLRVTGSVERCELIGPAEVVAAMRIRPDQYRDFAALRGDKSDALPGVPGVGPVYATKLLLEFDSGDAAFTAARNQPSRVAGLVGKALADRLADPAARDAFRLNRRIMTMRTGLNLGNRPGTVPGRLPLSPAALTAALDAAGLDTVRAAAHRLLTAGFPGPPPQPDRPAAVSAGQPDPYHCSECGCDVAPHPKSIRQHEPVICGACDLADPRMALLRKKKGPAMTTAPAPRIAS